MIHARLTEGGAELFALFYHENSNKEVAYQKVINLEDAQRILDFYNRKHITVTLISWLKQRNYVIQAFNGKNAANAYYLLVSLQMIQLATYVVVLRFIRDHIDLFNECIPWKHDTAQYRYYEREIMPLLDFCTPKKKD